ncbi:hypothetical protein O0I10_012096 [Lichtheimia ornata]|uniref:Uncharacterized protein n=1 Tax=Lichtheimia ornata TaxID=688661 RepID=A0AAD7XTD5_9FUNG|nr:uncharacterized protein O0I10_012096 [Lichtheimia ornata]KAJ8652283.1 hypothetical protein O0I10_012096 [Lichtheimia ornata]
MEPLISHRHVQKGVNEGMSTISGLREKCGKRFCARRTKVATGDGACFLYSMSSNLYLRLDHVPAKQQQSMGGCFDFGRWIINNRGDWIRWHLVPGNMDIVRCNKHDT